MSRGAVRGDDVLKIQQRAGHTTFAMTRKYIRTAEAEGEAIGAVFPALPEEVTSGTNRLLIRPEVTQLLGTIVEAPGIETGLWQIDSTMEHGSGTIGTDEAPADVSDCASKCAIVRGVVTESSGAYELSDVVETALARALVLAAEAKRWDVVLQVAAELQRRGGAQPTRFAPSERLNRSSNV